MENCLIIPVSDDIFVDIWVDLYERSANIKYEYKITLWSIITNMKYY